MLMKFPIDVLVFKYNQNERVEYTCIYRKPHALHYLKQENKTIVSLYEHSVAWEIITLNY